MQMFYKEMCPKKDNPVIKKALHVCSNNSSLEMISEKRAIDCLKNIAAKLGKEIKFLLVMSVIWTKVHF